MTAQVTVKTKKELKRMVSEGESFRIIDPMPFGDKHFYFPNNMPEGATFVTNHPKRSWFAVIDYVDADADGHNGRWVAT